MFHNDYCGLLACIVVKESGARQRNLDADYAPSSSRGIYFHAVDRSPSATASNSRRNFTDETKCMDSEVASLRIYVAQLRKDRANKLAFIASFRRLPLELLGEIAVFCLEMGESPSKLNSISSSMRAAVNGMKSLWTRMHYYKAPYGQKESRPAPSPGCVRVSNLNYMKLVLKRAKPMPLRVTLEPWNYDVLRTIEPFIHRVRTLHIVDNGAAGVMPDLGNYHVYNLASIEELSFSGDVDYALGAEHFLAAIVHNAMKGDFTLSLSFPATALVRLIPGISTLSVKSLKLDILLRSWNDKEFTALVPLKFSNLKSLSICGACSHLLPKLLLPNLSTLSLRHYDSFAATGLPANIRTLTLEGMEIGWYRNVIESAQRLSSLTHITMVGVEMRVPINFKLLAPNLQMLHIYSLNFYDAKDVKKRTVDLATIIGPEGLFGDVPQLRELSITSMKLDHNTSSVLSLHSSLKRLNLFRCWFRFSLLSSLANGTGAEGSYLPNLIELRVQECRTSQLALTFEEFRRQCAIARPNLHIIGDDMEYLTSTLGLVYQDPVKALPSHSSLKANSTSRLAYYVR
ncbi:hypothetical protein CPB86DRAFT_828662 [Serendipita vermifera]|nr:hypothetical protein CPB86DRAFT_828662 [Serendipita vermifera]